MNLMKSFGALLVALLVASCAAPSDKTAEQPNQEGPAPAVDPRGTVAEGGAGRPPVPLSQLPAELKHAAFEYYGLGNPNPIDMEVKSTARTGIVTGTQQTLLRAVEGGKGRFSVERTGGLAGLGSMDLELDKDGIYVTGSSIAKIGERKLEIPADLTPGKTWETTTEIAMNDQSLKVKNTYKVEGMREVDTPGGKKPALLITSTGEGVINGRNARMETKSWYVKGLGGVRAEIVTKYEDGTTETTTITQTN